MTTIFTRNLAIFILSAVLLKCVINMHSNNIFISSKSKTEIVNQNKEGIIKFTGNETVSEQSCLSANTGFNFTKTKDNSVGTVNITRSYGTYSVRSGVDNISAPDLLAENKVVIKISPQLSKVVDKKMQESSDIEYILSGTELEEIYNNSNIVKIEKIKLRSNQGEYYLFELKLNTEDSSYGEKYLSHMDKIRRFTSF